MLVMCVNLNYLNNVNGTPPGRRWETFDPEVEKVYEILEIETFKGIEYYKLYGCSVLWLYESTSFSPVFGEEVNYEELEYIQE